MFVQIFSLTTPVNGSICQEQATFATVALLSETSGSSSVAVFLKNEPTSQEFAVLLTLGMLPLCRAVGKKLNARFVHSSRPNPPSGRSLPSIKAVQNICNLSRIWCSQFVVFPGHSKIAQIAASQCFSRRPNAPFVVYKSEASFEESISKAVSIDVDAGSLDLTKQFERPFDLDDSEELRDQVIAPS